jgi:hypothetical protein
MIRNKDKEAKVLLTRVYQQIMAIQQAGSED